MFAVLNLVLSAGPPSLEHLFMGFGVIADRCLGCPSLFETFFKQILLAIRLIDSDFNRYRRGRLALFSLNVQCLGVEAAHGADKLVAEHEL